MPKTLGRYEIIETIGEGSMGVVYKARDPLIGRMVAIKAVDLHDLQPEERERYETRFHQEAMAAGSLNHPNLVTIYDVGNTGDVAYLAMELLEGEELGNTRERPLDEVLDIAIQAAAGLACAHKQDIVHRDIKPGNIMLLKSGVVKILDFGIARLTAPLMKTRTGLILGSPLYMSPEQIKGMKPDSRSDIFSLGTVLYEMLTGLTPFSGRTSDEVMRNIVNNTPTPPSTLNAQVNEMLDGIVARCLAKDPDERYQHAEHLENDLRECRGVLLQARTGVPHHRHYFMRPGRGEPRRMSRAKRIALILLIALVAITVFELVEILLGHDH